jgi:hypothetical protein
VLCLVPGVAAAQSVETAPSVSTTRNVPLLPPPQVPIAPQFGSGFLSEALQPEQPLRSAIKIIPNVTLSEEYNDNILLDNQRKVWDFITGITPGLSVALETRTYHLLADYNFTAEFYARDSTRNNAFANQHFTLDALYRPTDQLTLSLIDSFTASTDSNLVAAEGVSTGRNRSWSNTLAPAVAYQIDQFWSVRAGGSWTTQRFQRDELSGSDVYRANVELERAFSRQLRGSLGYEFAYFDIEREDKSTTHTPRVGVNWRLTPTITVAVSAGPTFEMKDDGADRITPAVRASYDQRTFFGSVGLAFDRQVATAGGLGGTSDNTSVGGQVELTRLLRGLTVSLAPRYSWVQSADNDRIDIQSFTVPLQVTYRITAWMAAVARYQFFRQRSDSEVRDSAGGVIANDADQNRIFVGLQFGYPFTFDRP